MRQLHPHNLGTCEMVGRDPRTKINAFRWMPWTSSLVFFSTKTGFSQRKPRLKKNQPLICFSREVFVQYEDWSEQIPSRVLFQTDLVEINPVSVEKKTALPWPARLSRRAASQQATQPAASRPNSELGRTSKACRSQPY